MSKEYKDVIVGLDVGTSKVVCMVAEIRPDGRFSVIGRASTPVHGLKRGVVVNIESTVEAIARAVQEAEMMSSCKIHDVYTGITGSHIKSFNSNGIVAIKDNKEVSQQDVERVLEVARAVHIPAEQQILHILRQEFIIDGQGGVPEPVGMITTTSRPSTHSRIASSWPVRKASWWKWRRSASRISVSPPTRRT